MGHSSSTSGNQLIPLVLKGRASELRVTKLTIYQVCYLHVYLSYLKESYTSSGRWVLSPSTDEETEFQRGRAACPVSSF